MNVMEIILLVGGIGVFVASYFVGNKKEVENEESVKAAPVLDTELSEEDKNKIKEQVDSIIQDKMDNLSERTEARMDKISNTKILELNDYAETIMNEINRNHNETVFLYDMLNEKAKEVKNTVKDVNIAKKEVDRITSQRAVQENDNLVPADTKEAEKAVQKAQPEADKKEEPKKTEQSAQTSKANASKANMAGLNNQIDSSLYTNINKSSENVNYGYKAPEGSKDLAKERLMELVKSASAKTDKSKTDKAEAEKAEGDKTEKVKPEKAKAEKAKAEKSKTEKNKTEKPKSDKPKVEKAKKTSTTKKATSQAGELVKMAGLKADDIVAGFDENMTNNEKIEELSKKGVSNKEIAKVLNIGLGEVKLVVDVLNSSD